MGLCVGQPWEWVCFSVLEDMFTAAVHCSKHSNSITELVISITLHHSGKSVFHWSLFCYLPACNEHSQWRQMLLEQVKVAWLST